MDSSDDDISLDEEEPLIDRRAKRKKKMRSSTAPSRLAATGPPPSPYADPYAQPAFTWIPGQYVPSQRCRVESLCFRKTLGSWLQLV